MWHANVGVSTAVERPHRSAEVPGLVASLSHPVMYCKAVYHHLHWGVPRCRCQFH